MLGKWLLVIVAGACFLFSGCETAKGFKKDVQNTWHNTQGLDGWMKDNLW